MTDSKSSNVILCCNTEMQDYPDFLMCRLCYRKIFKSNID